MNKRELTVKKQLESEGWKVLRGGSPDFIALKVDNGNIIEFKGVEVKSETDRLSYAQKIYQKVFQQAGVNYEVVVPDQLPQVDNLATVHPKPPQASPSPLKLAPASLVFTKSVLPNLAQPKPKQIIF